MIKAGLLKEGRETGRPYDAFRDRIMFPIRNLSGRVIAFGGRRLHDEKDGEPSAKYVNSPETSVYSKGRELFGLWEARNEIRRQDRAIIVEGYTDAISLVAAGIPIVCASLGTSLTENQARLIKRFTQNVYVLYDGDDAGLNAAKRASDILLTVGTSPRVLILPEDEDPDSFVKKRGSEAVWEIFNHAPSPVEFQLHLARRAKIPAAQTAKDLVQSAANILSPVEQETFLREVSSKTGISMDALLRELARNRTKPAAQPQQQRSEIWPTPGPEAKLSFAGRSCAIWYFRIGIRRRSRITGCARF
jgi:DNA primase